MSTSMLRAALFTVLATAATPAAADNQLWAKAGVSAGLTKRTDLELSYQMRFDQDISRLSSILPEVELAHRFKSWLRIGGGYRLEYERDNNGDMVVRHRLTGDVKLRKELDPVRIDYRFRFAQQIRPDANEEYRTFLRHRFDVSYRRSDPWFPFVSFELFHALDDFNKYRLTFGTSYEHDRHEVEAFFRLELHEEPDLETYNILGLGYTYRL